MIVTLTGVLAWVHTMIVLAISVAIMALGAVVLWNKFILIPMLNHLELSSSVWGYMVEKKAVKEQREDLEQKKKELKMLEMSHNDTEWFYCIEQILKGHRANVLQEYKDQEWVKKICRTLGYSDGDIS